MTTIPGFPKPSDPVRRRPDARFALRWVRFTGLRPTTVRAKFVSLVVAGDARQVSRDGGQADHRTCANKTGLTAYNEGCHGGNLFCVLSDIFAIRYILKH